MTPRARAIAPLLIALANCGEPDAPGEVGNPAVGRAVIARLECGVCHTIPRIAGARGIVAPSLDGFARRSLIGGVVANEPNNLVRWVRDAPSMAPDTAMPALPIDELEARDVAAYLYTLR